MSWKKTPEYVKRVKKSKRAIFNTSIVIDEIAERRHAEEQERLRKEKSKKEKS